MASITSIRCLISIKNGYLARLSTVRVPYSKLNLSILSLLLREGIVQGFVIKKKDIVVSLVNSKFVRQRVREMRIHSKPSNPIFLGIRSLERIDSFVGSSLGSLNVLNTSKGVLTLKEALRFRVGGELLFISNPLIPEIVAHR